jgi:hypothetical protein
MGVMGSAVVSPYGSAVFGLALLAVVVGCYKAWITRPSIGAKGSVRCRLMDRPGFQDDVNCVACSFMNIFAALQTESHNLLGARYDLLRTACDEESGNPGYINLKAFFNVLMASQKLMGFQLGQCCLGVRSLDQLVVPHTGVILVDNGRGHAVGLSHMAFW